MSDLILPDGVVSEEQKQLEELKQKKHEQMVEMFQKEAHKLKDIFPEIFEYILEHGARVDTMFKNLELMFMLHNTKPKNILELGSGLTTAVFAKYAKATGAKFTSIEESEAYRQQTERILKKIDLSANIVLVPVIKNDKECYYDGIPEDEYDFVYVDGPNNANDMENGLVRANGRMFMGKIKNIVYDMSFTSVQDFLKTLKGYDALLGYPFLMPNMNYHTVFTKTNYWWE